MSAAEVRPEFTIYVNLNASEALDAVKAYFAEDRCAVHGWMTEPYAEFRMPDEKGRFWAPRLSIYAEDTAGGAHLMCRLGPKPDVWTLYIALYAVFIINALVFAGLTFSKVGLGEPFVWPLVGVIVPVFAVGVLYFSAFVGQGLGRDDMRHLHRELFQALAVPEGADPVETKNAPGVPAERAAVAAQP